ncbi:MAG: LapA family protein [Actinomycetota bacterium]|nr:LapA family protein [Actinomycetota bacterium]
MSAPTSGTDPTSGTGRTRRAGAASGTGTRSRAGTKAAESDAPEVKAAADDPVPVIEKAGASEDADPVIETDDPKKALAASELDLAKLRAVRRSRVIKAAVLTAIALIFIAFVLQNAQPVDVRLVAWTVPVGLIWVIVASALLGAVGGYLVGRPDKELRLHGPNRRDKDSL